MTLMLLVADSASGWCAAPHKIRIDVLVQSGAHELALAVLKKASAGGDSSAGSDTAQALRLLELLAAIGALLSLALAFETLACVTSL